MKAVWGPRLCSPDQLLAMDNKSIPTDKQGILKRWTAHFSPYSAKIRSFVQKSETAENRLTQITTIYLQKNKKTGGGKKSQQKLLQYFIKKFTILTLFTTLRA